MENSYDSSNGNGPTDNGHMVMGNSSYQPCIKRSLPWLDLRVFYVRVSKCEIDDSTPEYLTLNHIPLNRDTLLEVNGVRASIYSDGALELCNSHGSFGESNTQGQGWSIDCESDITPGTGFFKAWSSKKAYEEGHVGFDS
ncbi:hypothetical protein CMV_012383 [Castanea mollissima]|uniref:Uncharacterized protein n=1 Tax=Castanea mollissima TaxID=60419 RepID=A0A8J4VJ48_9ROSI|nr:hypothetical protein CMV_012383 [Castanea mollissima]